MQIQPNLTHIRPRSCALDSSVGRALHRYPRGRGFESRFKPEHFFQVLVPVVLRPHLHLFLSFLWLYVLGLTPYFVRNMTLRHGRDLLFGLVTQSRSLVMFFFTGTKAQKIFTLSEFW